MWVKAYWIMITLTRKLNKLSLKTDLCFGNCQFCELRSFSTPIKKIM